MDITNRLRDPARGWHPDQIEAADEIDRLRAQLEATADSRDEAIELHNRRLAQLRDAEAKLDALRAELAEAKRDAGRLDWMDSLNARLNAHYGTTYRWKLVLSPNVVRLMAGPASPGHIAAIDLHDSDARGAPSCRDVIDAEMAKG